MYQALKSLGRRHAAHHLPRTVPRDHDPELWARPPGTVPGVVQPLPRSGAGQSLSCSEALSNSHRRGAEHAEIQSLCALCTSAVSACISYQIWCRLLSERWFTVSLVKLGFTSTLSGGYRMAKYLLEVSYTAEGAKGLIRDGGSKRRAAAEAAARGVGAKVESFHFAFGARDAYLIVDAPDNISIAAVALAVNAAWFGADQDNRPAHARRSRPGGEENARIHSTGTVGMATSGRGSPAPPDCGRTCRESSHDHQVSAVRPFAASFGRRLHLLAARDAKAVRCFRRDGRQGRHGRPFLAALGRRDPRGVRRTVVLCRISIPGWWRSSSPARWLWLTSRRTRGAASGQL